jgi:hypothetical protein
MRKFQIWWLKLCCFLTGYNYFILSNCSEISTRKAKKYTSALLIVGTVWAFVGYSFCERYLKLDTFGSIIGAIIAIIIIIQIERQILLTDKPNAWLKWTRCILAILMAVVGSLIIDQIIFKDDIEKNKIESNQKHEQIVQINNALLSKEGERKLLLDDINRNPTIKDIMVISNQVPITNTTTDSLKKSTVNTILQNSTSKTIRDIPNPKTALLQPIDNQIAHLNAQKMSKENTLLSLKGVLEKEVGNKVGFLDELKVMLTILEKSTIALIVYLIWLLFLLILELLILIAKSNDTDSDYERTIRKQMDIHSKKIELL